ITQAAVIPHTHNNNTQLIAYTVTNNTTINSDDEQEIRIGEWQDLYNTLYSEPDAEFGENFAGWNSSYDGQPIPLEDMREWRDSTVDRIKALHPRRVLEIGVGTGLLLAKIAPDCD
uniref:hypothetical protein n=1 Tax=unclassified Streptomyces TaxID=2593676 RepID=UPI0024A7A4D6